MFLKPKPLPAKVFIADNLQNKNKAFDSFVPLYILLELYIPKKRCFYGYKKIFIGMPLQTLNFERICCIYCTQNNTKKLYFFL